MRSSQYFWGWGYVPLSNVVIPHTWAPSSGFLCLPIVIVNCKITSPKTSQKCMINLSFGCSPEPFQNIWRMEEIVRASSATWWSLESSSAFHFAEHKKQRCWATLRSLKALLQKDCRFLTLHFAESKSNSSFFGGTCFPACEQLWVQRPLLFLVHPAVRRLVALFNLFLQDSESCCTAKHRALVELTYVQFAINCIHVTLSGVLYQRKEKRL